MESACGKGLCTWKAGEGRGPMGRRRMRSSKPEAPRLSGLSLELRMTRNMGLVLEELDGHGRADGR